MDVDLQILKHLPRDAQPMVSFIDTAVSDSRDTPKKEPCPSLSVNSESRDLYL
jgi:hypothetical protein